MRPTCLEVNLTQLGKNLDNIRAHVSPAKVLVVLKANAYGHGVDGVAPFIAPRADYIGVALVEEAVHLRKLGIATPILVMGGSMIEQLPLFFDYNLTLAASSPDLLTAAHEMALISNKRLKVHLKIDTGMERIGVREYEAGAFIEQSLACSHLEIEGIFTHFANAESTDKKHSHLQLERFQEVLSFYEKLDAAVPPIIHAANSAATLIMPESHFTMVRPGVLFYGVYPARDIDKVIEVKPALKWKSRVVFSKITRPGRPVSYGSMWQADRPVRIVTIPCGYADGYFRRMSNHASVIINGNKYPQVGRICMDQFMVNAGDDDVNVGDEVILLGDTITVEELAGWAGTNEYEIMTNISARVPRAFVID